MPTEALRTARDYFDRVLRPNRDAFFGNASNFANAVNLATSLYHFHEWVFVNLKPQLETEFARVLASGGQFWQAVEGIDPRFGYIRDIANASKHVTIGGRGKPKPSTGMTHIANTHIITIGYGEGAYGAGKYGGAPNVVFDDDGQQISFDDCAAALFDYWGGLLTKINAR